MVCSRLRTRQLRIIWRKIIARIASWRHIAAIDSASMKTWRMARM